MKFIHSFWSKAYFRGRWNQSPRVIDDLYCFALSSSLLNKHGSIELITDDFGASLLSGLPYSNIHTTLNDIEYWDSQFWTGGKIYAISSYGKPCIHVDGDVFFTDKSLIKNLVKKDWDVLVQSKEIGHHYNTTYPQLFDEMDRLDIYSQDHRKYNFAYNTGVFGIRDLKLIKDYSFTYFSNIYNMERREIKLNQDLDINVAMEQSFLTYMAQERNLHVKEILTGQRIHQVGLEQAADELGYIHLWGKTKYSPAWQKKVRARLKREFPEVAERIEKKSKDSFFYPEDSF